MPYNITNYSRGACAAIAAVAISVAVSAWADPAQNKPQPAAPQSQPNPVATAQPLTCSDFRQNADGSWSPVHPVTLNGIGMGPGMAFHEGVAFGGVDLAAVLDRQCVGASSPGFPHGLPGAQGQ